MNRSKRLQRLVLGDCLEIMPKIPDGIVDMVLCDLPYGMTRNKWDSVIPLDRLWKEWKRVLRGDGVVVLTTSQPFTSTLVMSNLQWFKYSWIWGKNIASGHLRANKCPMRKHEDVVIFSLIKTRYNPQMGVGASYNNYRIPIDDSGDNYGNSSIRTDTINKGTRYPTSIIYFNREVGLHPTQKPVPLFEYLIKTYTNPGDMVLDNCCGSGTTGVACVNTGRNCIQIERDEGYYKVAMKRLREAMG